MTVNYIIVWFLGKRRVKTVSDPRYFIHHHLGFLRDNNSPVDRVTIVLNTDSEEEEALARETLKEYDDYYTEIKFMVRENSGFSYAGWNYAINDCIRNGEHFDYYVLIEDDYAPGHPDFIELYASKMTGTVAYVCQRLSDTVLSKIFNTQIHPGISCGMLAGDAAEDAYRVFGSALKVFDTKRYDWKSLEAQVKFMDNVTQLGYTLDDSASFSSVVFVHYNAHNERGWYLTEYGDPTKPRVIEPVVEWSIFKPLEEATV